MKTQVHLFSYKKQNNFFYQDPLQFQHSEGKNLFFFGLADMPIQMASVPVAAFIPNYYGQDLGISLAAVGLVLLLSRSFDAITDPLIGRLSDRTVSPWGRRRVWVILAVPVLMISIYKLFFGKYLPNLIRQETIVL